MLYRNKLSTKNSRDIKALSEGSDAEGSLHARHGTQHNGWCGMGIGEGLGEGEEIYRLHSPGAQAKLPLLKG